MDPTTIMAVMETAVAQTNETAAATGITGKDLLKAGALIGAGICMGFGAIGRVAGVGIVRHASR